MFLTVVLEKALESPLDCKEIQLVHPKVNQSWIFIGRTDAKAEAPTPWLPDVKNWLIGKNSDAGKDWKWEEKTTEDEIIGWHHWLDGHEFEQALGVGDGQGGLVCCGHGVSESDMAEQLNWTELNSAYKLNKQGDHIPLCFTHFPIWNQSVVPRPVLTIASWPAYRFLRRQIRWSGVPISLRIFQFVVIHTDRMERGCQIELHAKE